MVFVKHKNYTAAFKLTPIERAVKVGNCAAMREYNVDEWCIWRWKAKKDDAQNQMSAKKWLHCWKKI